MDVIGEYDLLEALGKGGMGVVYHAVHRQTEEHVALKTVAVSDEKVLHSIRREIHTLARLSCPGIIPVLDHGLHDGMPWYTMPLIRGKTLREYCKGLAAADCADGAPSSAPEPDTSAANTWWTETVPEVSQTGRLDLHEDEIGAGRTLSRAAAGQLQAVLRCVRRLCLTLAYLHGEGVVHRDIKPENVILTADGQPVVVDFGLLTRFRAQASREAVDLSGLHAGTVAYMAPEQLLGEYVDARADLYSVGCVLFELVTGRVPFRGVDLQSVVARHLYQQPAKPSDLVRDVPGDLDDLVLNLLSKSPRDRLGYADVVASRLATMFTVDVTEELTFRVPQAPRPYVYRPGFFGRRRALATARKQLDLAEEGTGAMLLVVGDSGIGKTRLIMEIARQAVSRGMLVLAGDCGDRSPAPLQPLREALQLVADRCRARGPEEYARLLGERGALLAQYEPALSALQELENPAPPPPLPAPLARARLFSALGETFAALAAEQPVVLIIDDLQLADDLSLGFLEQVAREAAFRRKPVLVVAGYRGEEAARRLLELGQSTAVTTISLGRLRHADVAAIVGDMLAMKAAPRQLSELVATLSEGNAYFVAEYISAAVERGVLVRDHLGRWVAVGAPEPGPASLESSFMALPQSLEQLVNRRLVGLSADATQLLGAAAAAGREVSQDLLRAMFAMPDENLLGAIGELLQHRILEDTPRAGLRFVHSRIREVAYERLDAPTRAALHRRAAQAIEATGPTEREARVASLGLHWELAGEKARARQCYLAGARRSTSRYAQAEAENLFTAFLRLAPEPSSETVDARRELAFLVLRPQGRHDEARVALEIALAEARQLGDRSRTASCLQQIGAIHLHTGDLRRAEKLFEQALSSAYKANDRASVSKSTNALANLYLHQGRHEAAQMLYRDALAVARRLGQDQMVGTILNNLAAIQRSAGDHAGAERLLEEALVLSRRLGDRRLESNHLGNLAEVLYEAGRLDEAELMFSAALAASREVGDTRLEGIQLLVLARIDRLRGRGEAAHRKLERSAAALEAAGDVLALAFVAIELGRLALAANQCAADRIREAGRLLKELDLAAGSELAVDLAALIRAQEAFLDGHAELLTAGQMAQDLTPGIRRALYGQQE